MDITTNAPLILASDPGPSTSGLAILAILTDEIFTWPYSLCDLYISVIYISYCVVYSQVVFSLRLYYLIKSCCTKFGAWITVSFIHRSSVVAAPLAIEMAYFC